MTSATLYREGPDLDELLAELDAEHGGSVRVVDVNYLRDGGVMGFFARRMVGVHYTLDGSGPAPEPTAMTDHFTPAGSGPVDPTNPLDVLLRAAEAAEMVESGVVPPTLRGTPAVPGAADPTNVEFARMLLEMAAQKAAERAATEPAAAAPVRAPWASAPLPAMPAATPSPVVEPAPAALPVFAHPVVPAALGYNPSLAATPSGPTRTIDPEQATNADLPELLARVRTRPVGAHRSPDADEAELSTTTAPAVTATAPSPVPVTPPLPAPAPTPPARTEFTLRRQLTELGVPAAWVPEGDPNAFLVIEQLVERIQLPARIDPAPGELIVVVGPARAARAEATQLCQRLRLDPSDIVTAGGHEDEISHRRQAATLARSARNEREQACVVVVATDATVGDVDPTGLADLEWAAGIVAALEPDHTIAVVDATSKPSDVSAMIDTVGPVTALAVLGAGRTASPAALWRLGVAVATLDGRPATRGAWAALLIDRLAVLDGS